MIFDQASNGIAATAGNGRRWRTLLAGTALGCTLAAAPAMAEVIDQTSAEDIEIATGDAEAISAYSTGGKVSISAGSIENVATSGSAVYGASDTSSVVIDVDGVQTGGNGIEARTPGGGDITIDVETVDAGIRGIYTRTLFLNPEEGFTSGNTIVRAKSVIGRAGNAVVAQGYSVVVDSDRLEGIASPNYTAATLYVSAGEGGANVDVIDTVAKGYGQWGIEVYSDGETELVAGTVTTDGMFGRGINAEFSGNGKITAGTISTSGQESHGIAVDGYTTDPTSVVIDSGTINTSGDRSTAIFTPGSGEGSISITSNVIAATGADSHGIVVAGNPNPAYERRPVSETAGTGALSIVSGTIDATGPGGRGIIVDHQGPISVTSNSITAGGSGIYMWAKNSVDIISGSVTTAAGPGIVVYGAEGDVTLDSGTVSVGELGDAGIYVETSSGNITITADETTTTSMPILDGFTADGVVGQSGTGNVSIEAGKVSVAGEYAWGVAGITAGAVDIKSTEVTTSGVGGSAIYAGGSAGVSIDSGSVMTSGNDAYGIRARSLNGKVVIGSGSITTTGDGSTGIFVPTSVNNGSVMAGDITITSGSIETNGANAAGISVGASAAPMWGMRDATGGTGTVSIISDTIQTSGPNSWGIAVDHVGPISITSNAITTGSEGGGGAGIYVWAGSTVDIDSGLIETPNGPGIVVYGSVGDVKIEADTTHVGEGSDVGVWARTTTGNITIVAGETSTARRDLREGEFTADGVTGISAGGGEVSVRAANTSVVGDSAWGVTAYTSGKASVVNGTVTTSGLNGIGVYGRGDVGGATIESDSVTTIGDGAHGVYGVATTGDVKIASRAVSVEGANANAVVAEATTGDVSLTVTGEHKSVQGVGARIGTSGNVSVDIAATGSLKGNVGLNLVANSATADIVNAGTISGAQTGILTSAAYNASAVSETNVVNRGTITGEQNDGVLIFGTGSVVNSGTIQGLAGDFTDGVQLQYYPGQNSGLAQIGSIVNEADGTITGARYGIILAGGGTIENAGTIRGGTTGVLLVDSYQAGKTGSLTNSGTIEGGAFIALSSGTATNTGTIVNGNGTGFVSYGVTSLTNGGNGKITGRDEGEDGLGEAVSMTVGYDQSGNYTGEAEAVSFDNEGTIEGEVSLELKTANLSFKNSGLILGTPGDSVIDLEVETEEGGAGRTVTFDNSGQIRGSIETELYAANVSFTNSGSILAVADEGEGEPALDIENYTWASQEISFTNAAGGSIVSSGVRASGLLIEAGAGLIAPENDGDQPTVSDDLSIKVAISAANQGTISANDGGEVEDVTEWEIPGVDSFVTFATGVGISALAPTSEASLTNGTDGVIEATGETSMAVYANAGQFTLTNAGRISGGAGTAIDDRMMDGGDLNVVRDVLAAGGSYVAGAIQTVNSVDTIVNTGTIEGSISLMAGDDSLTNSGTITGSIDFGAGDDLLVLKTGSIISGAMTGGEGDDALILDGTSTTLTNLQTMTAVQDFETLSVAAGYWVANSPGAASVFDSVSIAQGATLDVREVSVGGGAASPILTDMVENNGLLILNFNSDDLADIEALDITGTGDVRLDGEANFLVDQGVMAFTGKAIIANGSLTLAGTGGLSGDVETSGDGTFVLGDGGTTGSFEGNLVNNGRFVFNRTDDYSFLGDFSGTGSFTKMGAGVLTFAGDYSYTGTTVIEGGRVKFLGDIDPETEIELEEGTFDISDKPQTIGQLSGTQDSAINVNNSQLTVNQTSNTSYAGAITGDGAIVKSGTGTLNLTGNSTYTGPTTVNGGALAVNGSIVSTVTVNDGGTLKGNGTVGGATVTSNGTVAPGNSIGTLRVAGDVTFAAGSTYEVEVNADGRSDQILATGRAIIQGGTVAVVAEAGTYRPFTEYLIIGADGGVTGTFNNVTSNFAYLTPTLTYGTNAVRLQLLRNDIDFAAVTVTDNQASAANAVESLGVQNDLYGDIAVLTEAGARTAFDALSGEAYASIGSGILANGRLVTDALLGAADTGGTGVWAQALGDWGSFDAAPGVVGLDSDHQGVIGGVNYGMNGFSVGAAFGASKSDYDVRGRASQADVDTKVAGIHAGYGMGPVTARIGGSYAWHDINASRSIVFPTFSEDADAAYDATTMQLFGEFGYKVALEGAVIEPFARIEHLRLKTDGFAEDGDTAALAIDEETRKLQFLSLGVRATGSAPVSSTLTLEPQLSAAWRRGWGDLSGRSSAAFDGGDAFDIVGAALPKNALDLDFGVGVRSGNVRVGVSYRGILSNQWNSDGGQVSIGFTF